MDSTLLTVKQAAERLHMDEASVVKLAEQGRLPAVKAGRQWRFKPVELDSWRAKSKEPPATQQPLPPEATGLPQPLTASAALTAERIRLNLKATDRDGVLRELVALVIPPAEARLSEVLFQALKAREELCPTCVNEGVAIPHARNALVGMVEQPVIAYGRHVAGVDFGALDGKRVHHFFLLCAPNVREHLQLLARLARLVNTREFRRKLAAATTPEQVLAAVRQAEPPEG